MKTFTIAAIIAAAATLAMGAPVAEPAPEAFAEPIAAPAELERRATTVVTLCKDQNFGTCINMNVVKGGGCYNFPGNYNDIVSSLNTGGSNVVCTFWTDGSCGGTPFTTKGQNPTVPAAFNDVLSSVRC